MRGNQAQGGRWGSGQYQALRRDRKTRIYHRTAGVVFFRIFIGQWRDFRVCGW